MPNMPLRNCEGHQGMSRLASISVVTKVCHDVNNKLISLKSIHFGSEMLHCIGPCCSAIFLRLRV
eukprot:1323381-Amorphochlora_amoeboformis.AAC.1